MSSNYYQKYLKYKQKYLELKKLIGGNIINIDNNGVEYEIIESGGNVYIIRIGNSYYRFEYPIPSNITTNDLEKHRFELPVQLSNPQLPPQSHSINTSLSPPIQPTKVGKIIIKNKENNLQFELTKIEAELLSKRYKLNEELTNLLTMIVNESNLDTHTYEVSYEIYLLLKSLL